MLEPELKMTLLAQDLDFYRNLVKLNDSLLSTKTSTFEGRKDFDWASLKIEESERFYKNENP